MACLRTVALVCLLVLSASSAGAQLSVPAQVRFQRLSVEQGLSQSIARAVYQDHQGFVWIATHNGLNLYDGHKFTLFKHEPDNPDSLPSSYVTSIVETERSGDYTLWIGTQRGIAAYDARRNHFVRYARDSKPGGLTHDGILTLFVDAGGVLWAGTQRGLNRFDAAANAFVPFAPPLTDLFVSSIAEDREHALWVGTGRGLNRIDASRTSVTRFVNDQKDPSSLNDDAIRCLLVDRRGRLWIGTDAGGLDRYEPAARRFVHHLPSAEPFSISGRSINAILEDARGELWVGVWGGGVNHLISPENGAPRFVAYRHDPADRDSLPIDDVNTLTADRAGGIWVGTYGGGVARFLAQPLRGFAHYKHVPGDPRSLGDDRVYALHVDRSGSLWVGTWGGLYRVRRDGTGFERFVPVAGKPDSISDSRVTSIAEAPDGAVWIGTLDGGVNRYDPAANAFRRYRAGADTDRVMALHVDRGGAVWIGTLRHGVTRLDPATGRATVFSSAAADPSTLSDQRVQAIVEDSRGRMWVGTSAGLNWIDPAAGRVTRAMAWPRAPLSLGGLVSSIAELPGERFWAGTDDGLVGFEMTGGVASDFRTYRERDGLSNDRVHRVLPDGENYLWVTTDNGITRVDPKGSAALQFDAADGLQGTEFKSGAFFDRETGRMFLGGNNGFNVHLPSEMKAPPPSMPVVLTGMTILNKPVAIGSAPLPARISDAGEVRLSPADSVFSFEFAALDFVTSRRTRYAYMLEGFDRAWNYTDATRRFATYTNLSPGTYTFRVRASKHGDAWSDAPQLSVVILPPFWMTWWFQGGLAAAIVLAIVTAHRRRVQAIERQRSALEQTVAARTQELRFEKEKVVAALRAAEDANAAKTTFLANISHEIRTPLNAMVGMADVLCETALNGEQKEYVGALQSAGEALSELIDDTLELSKIEVGRYELESNAFELRPLIEDTMHVVRMPAKKKGLELRLEMTPVLPAHVLGDSRALRRVLLNLLGNAIKFTHDGSVTLTVEADPQDDARLRFSVQDTGIGIAPEHQERIFDMFTQADRATARRYGGTGLGLALCRQLVDLMGGSLEVDSEPRRGSTFSFAVPLPPTVAEAMVEDAVAVPRVGAAGERRRLRILVVEDSAMNQMLIEAYLKDTPHDVAVVATGEIAVDEWRRGRFDVVLMDINLPGMDGYEAARRMRTLEAAHNLRRTAIIALTAHAFAEDVEASRRAGCDEHLAKPIRKAALLSALDRYARIPHADTVQPELPRELAAYVPEYVNIARRELASGIAALERGERTGLRTLGHNLKGSAPSFGLGEVGVLGARLEESAIAGDEQTVRACATELLACLARVQHA
jgi:signal transduction histidine kinase/ligand-binding sensor domain-containing protein/DNA-binding NarL/FixJ family response regulator